MDDVAVVWLQLGACAALIAVAGTKLSRYADVIADKTGLSGNWIGLILLATVTSLPELATGISSVTIADAPNIAVGDILGSCVFNLAILVMTGIVIVGLLCRPRTRVFGAVGWISLGLLTAYLLNSFVLYLYGE
jgi:cation:H+ antiporter